VTLDQFIAAHNGQRLDFDGKFGAQCVDLIDYYCRDVLGIPIIWANAIDWWGGDASFEGWTRNVWGDRNSKPPRGSIIVWGPNARAGTGIYGHIAIGVDPGEGLSFGSFDQNYPTGSACHVQRHTFDGVIGWGIRLAPPPPPDPCAQVKADLAAAQQIVHGQDAKLASYAAWIATRPQ